MPILGRLFDLDLDPLGGMMPHRSAYPPLTPEEQQSTLDWALSKGVGGLQWLGETLDKPGRAVRGLLAGQPRELLNLFPFTDTLGVTDPSQSVSGKDLLQQYGLQDEGAEGFLPAAAGFGAEVLTDPLTWLMPFGALAKGGRIAKAAGISTKGAKKFDTLRDAMKAASATQPDIGVKAARAAKAAGVHLRDVADEPMGGLFGATTGPLALLGMKGDYIPEIAQGAGARQIAEWTDAGLGAFGKTPVGRGLKSLTDYTTQGFAGEFDQPLAQAQTAASERLMPAAKGEWGKLLQPMHEIRGALEADFGKHISNPGLDELTNRLVRSVMEGRSPQEAIDMLNKHPSLDSMGGIGMFRNLQLPAGTEGKLLAMKDEWQKLVGDEFNVALDMGLDSRKMLQSEATQHSARQISRAATKAGGGARRLGTVFDSAKGRDPPTALFSTDILDQIYQDQEILKAVKIGEGATKAALAKGYVEDIVRAGRTIDATAGPYLGQSPGQGAVTALDDLTKHLIEQKDVVSALTQKRTSKYNPDWLKTQLKYRTDIARSRGNMEAIHETAFRNLVEPNSPGAVPLDDVYKAANMNPDKALNWFAKAHGADAAGKWVSRDIAEAIKSVSYRSEDPQWKEAIKGAVDWFNSTWKKHVTLPFPSFWTRNYTGAISMPFLFGDVATPGEAKLFYKSQAFVDQVASNPEKHWRKIQEWIAHDVMPMGLASRDAEGISGLSESLPGSLYRPKSIWNALKESFGQAGAIEGRAIPYVPGSKAVTGTLAGASKVATEFGGKMTQMVELMARAPHYEFLLSKGFDPVQAAERVKMMQVDYSRFTPFEKEYVKRIVPFYSYIRKTVPVMLGQMAERPGGAMAQTIRASNIGRSEGEFIPGYVGEGLSVELGENTYLSQLGLPTDQFADLGAFGPSVYGTIKRTGQKLGSMMAPWATTPVEMATGVNLFTGKPLTDMYQYPTDIIVLNQLAGNSQLGRYLSAGRTVGDPRKSVLTKAVNTLTGAKITQPSGGVERQKEYAAKKILDEMLREEKGIGSFSSVYVKEGQRLSPEAERLYRAYRGLVSEQQKERKAKKAAVAAE